MGNPQIGEVNPGELSGIFGDLMQKLGHKENGRAWLERLKRMMDAPLPTAVLRNPIWKIPSISEDVSDFLVSHAGVYKYITRAASAWENVKWVIENFTFNLNAPGILDHRSEFFILGLPVGDLFPDMQSAQVLTYRNILPSLSRVGLVPCSPLSTLRILRAASMERFYGKFLIGMEPVLCGIGDQRKHRLLQMQFPYSFETRPHISTVVIDPNSPMNSGAVILFQMKSFSE